MRALACLALAALAACGDKSLTTVRTSGVEQSTADVRAALRAYDGAPPVIPHAPSGVACTSCHNEQGMEVPSLGFAPPSPHAVTAATSALGRCEMCHVYTVGKDKFKENGFTGLAQDMRKGQRWSEFSPPVIPHQVLLRERCQSCHLGKAARAEIKTPHPERERCTQCHVAKVSTDTFVR